MKKKLLILFMMCVLGWLHPINAQTTFNFDSYSAGTTVESIDGWRSVKVDKSTNTAPLWQISPDISSSLPSFLQNTYGDMYKGVDATLALVSMSVDFIESINGGSASFIVNNYFVTEDKYDITSESSISWYVKKAPGTQTEYYEVVVSEDGNTWTEVLFFEDVSSSTMVNKTVSLEEYAEKELYLGFRHYRSQVNTSASALVIDNITISATPVGSSEPEPQPLSVTVSAVKENIYSDETTTLKAEAKDGTGNYNYSWTPATGLSATNVANPTFTPPSTGIYTFNCEVTDGETTKQGSVTVNVTERPVNPFAGKQYRVKVYSGNNGVGNYLTVFGHSTNSTDNLSSVGVSQYAENNNMQIFTIEESGNGNYYLKDQNGYYIICGHNSKNWNVDAVSTTNKTALTFNGYTGGTSTFYIQDSELTGGKTSNKNYFKVNSSTNVGSYPGYLVYCDEYQANAVTWVLEEVAAPEFTLELTANSTSVCEGNTVGLEANTKNAVGDCTYSWTPTTGLDDPDSATPTFTSYDIDQASEVVTFTCTATDSEGNEINATIDITINDAPEFVDLPGMITINAGETAIIPVKYDEAQYSFYVESTPYLDYTHYGYNYDDKDYDGCELSVLNLESDTELAITIYPIYGGCQATSTVNIKVIDESKEVVIGENNAVGNVYLPVRTESAYSLTQQIYTAEELGINEASKINSISFYATWSNGTARDIEVYLAHTALGSFPTGNPSQSESASEVLSDDFVKMTGNPNFDDEVIFTQGSWTTINFTTPFDYEPGNNIIVCVNDKTGSNTGGGFEFASYTRDGLRSISMYGSNAYTPSEIPAAGYTPSWNLGYNNQIKLGYEAIADATLSAEITADKTSLCDGDNSNQFTLTAKKIENATYEWYRGEELLGNTREFVYSNENPGTYTIRLEVTQGGNMKSTTIDLTINEMPNANITMKNTYVGVPTPFDVNDHIAGTYYAVDVTVDDLPSHYYSDNNNNFDNSHTFDIDGTFRIDVHAKLGDGEGCTNDSWSQVTVYPAANFTAENLCSGQPTTFTNTTYKIAGQQFYWKIGASGEYILSNGDTYTHTFDVDGTYEVSLKVTNENGNLENVMTKDIVVSATPVVDFNWNNVVVYEDITFTASASNAKSYLWKIDGVAQQEDEATLTTTFDATGNHTVSVIAYADYNRTGCASEELVKTITITDNPSDPLVNGGVTKIDMGWRPFESWMAPIDVVITADGTTDLVINSITIVDKDINNDNDFGAGTAFDYAKITEVSEGTIVKPGEELVLKLTHDTENPYLNIDQWYGETGTGLGWPQLNAQMIIEYAGSDEPVVVGINYTAYPPVTGDVVEFAHDVTFNNGTYTKANSDVLANYLLPGYDGVYYDAVYKIVLDKSMAITATVTGTNGRAYIYDATFGGEDGPGMTNFIGYEEVTRGAAATAGVVEDMMLNAGTYYLVAASESKNFSATITSTEFEEPLQATGPRPDHLKRDISTGLNNLQWTFGKYTAEYQVMFGTEQPFTDENILVDWNADIDNNSYALNSTLSPNTLYYWQVNAKNEVGTTTGIVWNFATEFDKVQNLAVSPDEISVGGTSVATWSAVTPESITGYNVLADGVKVNDQLITGTTYTITGLDYNGDGYDITVQAVYNIDGYEIYSYSEPVKLYVIGDGQVDGYVYAEDGEVIEGASVTFGTKTFTTDAQGYYSGTVTAGTYNAIARKSGYKKVSIEVSVPYNDLKTQDFILPYNLTMVEDVLATETVIDESVKVDWTFEAALSYEDFESQGLETFLWKTSAEYPWEVVPNGYEEGSTGYDSFGGYCVKSTNSDYDYDVENPSYDQEGNEEPIDPNDGNYMYANTTSFLELTVNVPFDDKISFDYRISADPNSYDHGEFYIDGTSVDIFGGNVTWSLDNHREYAVTAGNHTFRWEYIKDNGNYYNEDAFFIDNIKFMNNTNKFNIYVKDALTENATPKPVEENIAVEDYTYTDSEWWANAEDGIYKYGVSVEYNEEAIDLINEDFTSLQYWTTYDNNNSAEEDPSFAWHVGTEGNGMQALSGNSVFTYGAEDGYAGISHFKYYLVSRKINASKQSNLTFSYIAPYYRAADPDWFNRFRVLYGTSETGPWTPLTDYNETAVNSWTEVTLELPLMDNIYIAFESYNIYEPANNIYTGLGVGLDNVVVTVAERKGESNIAWSNMVAKGNQFITDGYWNVDGNWSRGEAPGNTSLAIISAEAQLTSDETIKMLFINEGEGKSLEIAENGALTLTSSEVYNEDGAESLVINAGGQLVHDKEGVEATFVKSIQHYSGAEILDGWYTISSPLATNVNATEVNNMISGEYDLYRYDEPTHYWENYEDVNDEEPGDPDNEDWGKNGGVIEKGRGYLYANNTDTELSFVGELNTAQVGRTLSAQADALRGFNLLGNPFAHDIYKGAAFDKENELRTGYYTLNYHGAWQPATDDIAIESGAGFLVQTDADQTINIDKVNTPVRRATNAMMAISVVNNQYEDVTYVSFKDGKGLEKIGHMNEYIPVVYVPYDFSAYAIATMSEDVTEIPVNFEAKTMGEYTFGVKTENCEYKVMTLVDNFTGKETNLLSDNYTFWATTTDEPNRFLIKLSKEDAQIEDSFIYIYNDELIFDNLSGDAIINVFDVLGRNVATFNNCGETTYRVSTDLFADGVYLVRLIEGNNVKVQKMVIE